VIFRFLVCGYAERGLNRNPAAKFSKNEIAFYEMRNYFFVRSLGTTARAGSNKSPLAILRKKTGYSFSNCKKALEVNENNIEKVCR